MSFLQGLATLLWVTWCFQRGVPSGTGFAVWFAFTFVTTAIHYAPRMVVDAWQGRRRWRENLLPLMLIWGIPGLIYKGLKFLGVSIDAQYSILPGLIAVSTGATLVWSFRQNQSKERSLAAPNHAELPTISAHSGAISPVDTV
jgi:hypothetical protein